MWKSARLYADATDGDPLQYVRWYVFGSQTAPGEYAHVYEGSHPTWAQALDKLAMTPLVELTASGCGQPPRRSRRRSRSTSPTLRPQAQHDRRDQHLLARARRLREPERDREALPELDHQLAHGIGNFRVVLYLEEIADWRPLPHTRAAAGRLKDELGTRSRLSQDLSADLHGRRRTGRGSRPRGGRDLKQPICAAAAFRQRNPLRWLTTISITARRSAPDRRSTSSFRMTTPVASPRARPTARKTETRVSATQPAAVPAAELGHGYDTRRTALVQRSRQLDGTCGAGDRRRQVLALLRGRLIEHGTNAIAGRTSNLARSSHNT